MDEGAVVFLIGAGLAGAITTLIAVIIFLGARAARRSG